MWFPLHICNVRVSYFSQVCNPWPDFSFSTGMGKGGAAITIGRKCKRSKQGHRREGMMEGNGLPVTDEICIEYFYQLSIAVIMCAANHPDR